jgi:hypothetical protein
MYQLGEVVEVIMERIVHVGLNARPRVRGAPGISQIYITINKMKFQVEY